jgi:hypothetical protein
MKNYKYNGLLRRLAMTVDVHRHCERTIIASNSRNDGGNRGNNFRYPCRDAIYRVSKTIYRVPETIYRVRLKQQQQFRRDKSRLYKTLSLQACEKNRNLNNLLQDK